MIFTLQILITQYSILSSNIILKFLMFCSECRSVWSVYWTVTGKNSVNWMSKTSLGHIISSTRAYIRTSFLSGHLHRRGYWNIFREPSDVCLCMWTLGFCDIFLLQKRMRLYRVTFRNQMIRICLHSVSRIMILHQDLVLFYFCMIYII